MVSFSQLLNLDGSSSLVDCAREILLHTLFCNNPSKIKSGMCSSPEIGGYIVHFEVL